MTGFLLLINYCAIVGVLAQAGAIGAGIHGVIEYPTRHFAPGIIVVAENLETGVRSAVRSGTSGAYQFTGLPLGAYRVSVAVDRFRPFTRDVTLRVAGWSEAVDVRLEVVAFEQITVVQRSPTIVETASDASLGVHLSREALADIPINNGRNLQSALNFVPGVVVTDSVGTLAQFTSMGQRRYANRLIIDGVSADLAVDVIGPGIGQAGSGALPASATSGGTQTLVPLAAVDEVSIRTSNAMPEHARTPGAQTIVVTRAGGDRVAAEAFTDFRPHQLTANSWFANADQIPKQHVDFLDTGAAGGGPLIRGHLYLFAAWERQQIDQSIQADMQVPSLAIRDSAPPFAAAVLNAYPRPNGADTGADLAALSRKVPAVSELSDLSLRFDVSLSSALRLFARINAGDSYGHERGSSGQVVAQSSTTMEEASLHSVTFGLAGVRGAMANDLRVNVTKNFGKVRLGDSPSGDAQPFPVSLFIRPDLAEQDAMVNVRLFADAGGLILFGRAATASQRQVQFVDTWSVVRGRHAWRAGIDYRQLVSEADAAREQYLYRFSGIADLLAGRVSQTTIRRVVPARTRRNTVALFAQDTFRLSKRGSLSYGVRYTVQPAPSSDTDVQPTLLDYESLPQIKWRPPGSRIWKTSLTNIAPQIATTWRLNVRPGRETLLRAGWSLTFDELTQPGALALSRSYPYLSTRTISMSAFPVPPNDLIDPIMTPLDATDANTYFALPRNLRSPRTYARQIGIQQALGPSQSVELSYAANTGRDLIYWSAYPASRHGSQAMIHAYTNDAASSYHALLVEYVRRLSRGLQARVAYTWSHAIDEDSGESLTPALPVRINDPATNRASADFDRRHVLQAVVSYRIGEDWQVDLVGSVRSGGPVSVMTAIPFGPTVYFVRPDLNAGVPLWLDDPTSPTGQRLNAQAFSIQREARQGTLGRNTVQSSPLRQLDMSLSRSMRLGTRLRAQLRIDAYNVFNVLNVGPPSTRMPSGTFGLPAKTYAQSLGTGTLSHGGLTPIQQVGDARSIQFGIRIGF